MSTEEKCPECGCTPPGHKVTCKTGNARAKASQRKMADKWKGLTPAERRAKVREFDRIRRSFGK